MSFKLKSIRTALTLAFLMFVGSIMAQTVKVNVKDSSGEPVIGASVLEKGTRNGGITDLDGNFSIKLTGKNSITISYIGMKTKTVDVKGKTSVSVVLEDDNTTLNDVVVIGYQTVRKKDLTGSVASVSSKQLEALPVSNVTEALTGKMAGVNITTTEGSPDAEVSIRVRGGGSLSQDNSPLYIVDGFPVSSISDVSPSDIQSIDVLKDASSTAIYGAKGANGVIIITTKSGKEGKTEVNFSAQYGIRKSVGEVKILNPYEYAYWQYELKQADAGYGQFDDLEIWRTASGRNYQDELFGRTGNTRQLSVNVSGGTKEAKYSASYARMDDKAIMIGSGFTRDNFNIKFQSKLNKWLTLDVNDRFSYTKVDGLKGGADTQENSKAYSVVARAVIDRPILPLNANLEDEESGNTFYNSVDRVNATYKLQTRLQNNLNASLAWKPIKALTFKTEFGYGWRYNNADQVWLTANTANSSFGHSGRPFAYLTRRVQKEWRWVNTANYDKKDLFLKGDHFNALLGQEVSSSSYTDTNMTSVDFDNSSTTDQILASMSKGTALPTSTYIGINDNMSSYFGRINYTLFDRYLFTFTMRADGSSRFTKGNRWGYFPSVALAWRVNEEPFMKSTEEWLSNLKLRLSYGTAGNNRIESKYMYTTFSAGETNDKSIYFGDQTANILKHGNILSNPDLKWETTITRNVGIDFGFFNSRLNGSIDVYWNTTKDLLMRQVLPGDSGYGYQYQNVGQTSNRGVELQLNYALVDKKSWGIDFNFNISYNRGKIDKFPGGAQWQSSAWSGSGTISSEDFKLEEGGRLGEVWGYRYDGVYTTNELEWTGTQWQIRKDADGNPVVANSYALLKGTLQPGALKLRDVNGDGQIDTNDKERLGNTIHPWSGGFGFTGRFLKDFDFTVFFNYQIGGKLINATRASASTYTNSSPHYNLSDKFALSERWTRINPTTGENILSSSYANNYISTYGADAYYAHINSINSGKSVYNPATVTDRPLTDWDIEDASFLRLQTITLGYTLQKKLVKKAYLSNVRVFVSGYNLFCLTNYSGVDPEVNACTSTPMTPGVDYAVYPKSYSVVGGINVSF